MYLYSRQWGLSPTEFWDMTLPEWFIEYWDRTPRVRGRDYAGTLTNGDIEDIREFMNGGS